MNRTTRLKKPQIPELDTLYQFDDLGGRPKYGGVEMSSTTDIPSFQEIMDETHSAVVAEATARDDADEALQAQIDGLSDDLTAESSARVSADNDLQAEIDAIVASSDVKDIVGTYADLQNYDTSELGDNDIIKVLQDETHQDETTYYRWILADEEFSLIGEEGPYYTKAATDALLNGKADKANTYTKTEVDGLIPPVVQTTGNSTTDVMSQNATTSMVYAGADTSKIKIGKDYSTYSFGSNSINIGSDARAGGQRGVCIGTSAEGGNYSDSTCIGSNALTGASSAVAVGHYAKAYNGNYATAIGYSAKADNGWRTLAIGSEAHAAAEGSIALGSNSSASTQGEMNIGTSVTSSGYSNSNYRLIRGVYDGQNAHDAATKGQLDSVAIQNAGAPTSSTVGTVGQLLEDTTNGKLYICTDATNPYVWEEVGGSAITELTSADYNWPTSNPDGVALWLLETGMYCGADSSTKIYVSSSTSSTDKSDLFIVANKFSSSTRTYAPIYRLVNNTKSVWWFSVDTANGGQGGQGVIAGDLLQGAGSSTTNAMSQNAVTSMIFSDPSVRYNVKIGTTIQAGDSSVAIGRSANGSYPNTVAIGYSASSGGNEAVSIGHSASANTNAICIGAGTAASGAIAIGRSTGASGQGSVALGYGALAQNAGEVSVGTSYTQYGYNSSNYRLISGVYDPQSAHDAATKGYVDGLVGNVAAALNAINNGGNA